MKTQRTHEVVFPDWFDEIGEAEAEAKGWLQGVEVVLSTGERQPLFFYAPVPLAQDLETETQYGPACIASPGMIVISRIGRDVILDAVDRLVREGYFPIASSAARCSLNEIIHTADPTASVSSMDKAS